MAEDKNLTRELQRKTERLIIEDPGFKVQSVCIEEDFRQYIYFGEREYYVGNITKKGEVLIAYDFPPEQAFGADTLRQVCERKVIKYTEKANDERTPDVLRAHAQRLVDIAKRLEAQR